MTTEIKAKAAKAARKWAMGDEDYNAERGYKAGWVDGHADGVADGARAAEVYIAEHYGDYAVAKYREHLASRPGTTIAEGSDTKGDNDGKIS